MGSIGGYPGRARDEDRTARSLNDLAALSPNRRKMLATVSLTKATSTTVKVFPQHSPTSSI
jgi:hypothetical protein